MKALFTLSTNLIPVMDFEKQFMAASGTTLDQARFSMAFIGALIAGTLIRWLPRGNGELTVTCNAVTGLVCVGMPAHQPCWIWSSLNFAQCRCAGPVSPGPEHLCMLHFKVVHSGN
jgi:hypothetical protein